MSASRSVGTKLAIVCGAAAIGMLAVIGIAAWSGAPNANQPRSALEHPSAPTTAPQRGTSTLPPTTPSSIEPLHATINGIEVGATEGTAWQCSALTTEVVDWKRDTAGTAFEVNLGELPERVRLIGEPRLGKCADGRLLWFELTLFVDPGLAGVNSGGAEITVSRVSSVRWWTQQSPAPRWSVGEVAGRAAAILTPVRPTFELAGVFIVDNETNGSTRIISTTASVDFVRTVAEALYK